MALKVLILCNFIVFSYSFLFDTSTNKPSTMSNNNNHDDLLKLLKEQNQELQQHRRVIMELKSRVERLEGNTVPTSTPVQPNSCRELEQKYQLLSQQRIDLTQNYSSLYQQYQVLGTEFLTEKNKTAKLEKDVIDLNIISVKLLVAANQTKALEKDVAALKQGQTVGQLQAIADLQNVTSKIKTDVKMLMSNSQAREQDFLTLYNQLTTITKERKIFEDTSVTNVSRIELKLENLNTNCTHSLNNLRTDIISLKTPVGFTAFGSSEGTINAETIIKFPDVASSFGLTGLSSFVSSGTFKAEKEGVYLVKTSINVYASNSSTFFNICKNNQPVHGSKMYYAGRSYSTQHHSVTSGSGSLVLQLAVGDTMDVRTGNNDMYVYQFISSITVIKIN